MARLRCKNCRTAFRGFLLRCPLCDTTNPAVWKAGIGVGAVTALVISLLTTPLVQTVASTGALVNTGFTSGVENAVNGGSDQVTTGESQSPAINESHSQANEESTPTEESETPVFDDSINSPVYDDDSVNSPYDLDETRIGGIVHEKVNTHRAGYDREPLEYSKKLESIAHGHSEDMATRNFFDHDNPDGQGPSERGEDVGFNCHRDLGNGWYSEGIAENIAQVYIHDETIYYTGGIPRYTWLTEEQIADDIFTGWKNSPGHNQNMLEKDYATEGIGIAIADDGEVYATENFC